jgi:hypothetical protein
MMMSSTQCTLGIEHLGPFWLLNILSWVFKKRGLQKATGGAKRQVWALKGK